jgi:hypothetical protein
MRLLILCKYGKWPIRISFICIRGLYSREAIYKENVLLYNVTWEKLENVKGKGTNWGEQCING